MTTCKHPFSILEVALALIIIVVGLMGVLTLLPVGFNANQTAISQSNAADAAEQFLHFATAEASLDWSFLNAFPDQRPTFESHISAMTVDSPSDSELTWSATSMLNGTHAHIFFNAVNSSDAFDPDVHNSGMFRVKQLTDNMVEDFDGIMRAWKEAATHDASGDAESILLHVEVSYPASMPYQERQKEQYATEIFRPDGLELAAANGGWCVTMKPIAPGVSIEGQNVIYDYLTVNTSSGNGRAYAEGSEPVMFTAPNDGNVVAQGCAGGGYAIADATAAPELRAHDFEFRFDQFASLTVDSFRLRMLDYGDHNPAGATQHSVSLVAYDAAGVEIDRDTLSYTSTADTLPRDGNGAPGDLYYTGDACSAAPGQPGNYTFVLQAAGIVRVALEFTHNGDPSYAVSDPGIAFTDLCFPAICQELAGDVNINPNNSPHNEFYVTKPDGSWIWRDDLHRDAKISKNGDYYNGPASLVHVKPKGNGNQNGSTVNGETLLLANKNTYTFAGDLNVRVWNDKPNNGRAMGHWWISFEPACTVVLDLGSNAPAPDQASLATTE
jgi:hypothetical protein